MKKSENVKKQPCEVIESQNDAIGRIVYRMKTFVTCHGGVQRNTRVVPLIIPTGWGKTRIAVQSIKKIVEQKTCTIILWPQTGSHISKVVWKRPPDWSNPYDKNASPSEVLGWKYLLNKNSDTNFYYVTRDTLKDKLYRKNIAKTRGPVFFVIDEWHSKDIIFQYIKFQKHCLSRDPINNARKFWRNHLFDELKNDKISKLLKRRKLFILLISATPIASTKHMDDIRFSSFQNELNKVLKAFNELVSVGNRYGGDFYKNYPELIEMESGKLLEAQENYKKKKEWKLFSDKAPSKDCWAEEYVQRSKILVKKDKMRSKTDYDPQIYMKEQALFCGLYPKKDCRQKDQTLTKFDKISNIDLSLKEKTLISLLENNNKRKFVVFCHHIGIAEHIENILNEKFRKNFAYYLRKNEFENEGFKQFNNSEDDKTLVLIVTDKHSQGVDLHKSEAWLIHYELSWNPIRIIQRFGRVWRLLNGNMTSPVAFHIPYTFSSEEEQIRRLEERWKILTEKNEQAKKEKGLLKHINIAPISIDIALGIRCTPSPYREDYK